MSIDLSLKNELIKTRYQFLLLVLPDEVVMYRGPDVISGMLIQGLTR